MINVIDLSEMSKMRKETFLFLKEIDTLLCKKLNEIDDEAPFDECHFCQGHCSPDCPFIDFNPNEYIEMEETIRSIRNYIDKCSNELGEDFIIKTL